MRKSENILAFEAALKENKELREKFEAAQKRIAENKEATSDGQLLVKAAAEIGFHLTMEELERAMAQNEELSDDELVNVAGGASPGDNFCWVDYYCFGAFHHDRDSVINRPCLADYMCVVLYNIEEDRHKTANPDMRQ